VSDEKNIINYTATDIEKYWKGNLSPAEMHAMEKAAMDDPFLADALEGYRNINLADAGLDSLKERLDKRVGAFVPILNLKRKRFTWVRAAAAIIIIVGVGLLVQQLVFKNKNVNSIVNVDNAEKNKADVANTEQQKSDTPKTATSKLSDTLVFKAAEKNLSAIKTPIITHAFSTNDSIKDADDRLAGDVKIESSKNDLTVKSVPEIKSAEKKEESSRNKEVFGKTALDSNKSLNEPQASAVAKRNDAEALYDANKNGITLLNNKYNYRVVDAQNNPVPFANVMNIRDNVGTYTDIRGNFNLVSSDSILNVQIKSLGYNSANYKLAPSNNQAGNLVLKEDDRKGIVARNKQVVSSISRKDSAEIQEPEVGWGNYNTYVANNIQIPENIRPKNTRSDVELSFDIDKTGQPINIKVTKSSQCKECDEEAIRLLKEGPKWKRKGKKSKATVSISVDQK